MKTITFQVADDEAAQAFVDDAKVTERLIAYITKDGDEVELQTVDMSITDGQQ